MLARLYNFTPGAVIFSGQVDDEFNQIVDLLNGTKIDQTSLKSSSATAGTLSVDNTGGGRVVDFKVLGVAKSYINAAGLYESLVATGTAPLVVASTTKVTNLNADQLDGLDESAFLRAINPSVQASGGIGRIDLSDGTNIVRLRKQAAYLLGIYDAVTAVDVVTVASGPGFAATFTGTVTGATPTAAGHLTTKSYVDARTVRWSWSAWQPTGNSTTGVSNPRYVVPAGVTNFTLRYIRVVVSGATGTGPPSAIVRKYDGAGAFVSQTAAHSPPVSTTAGTDQVYTLTLGTPVTYTAGQVLMIAITAGGSTALTDVTWIAEGDYTLG